MLEEKNAGASTSHQTTKKRNNGIIGFGYAIAALMIMALAAGCSGKGAGNSEKESADSAQSEMQSSTKNEAVAFDPAAMPQLQSLNKLTPADMTGVKACGFYGKVKTVKIKGHPGYDDFSFEFDKEGKIIKSYNDLTYKYSNATNYTNGYYNYRITFEETIRKDVSEYDNTEYQFDLYGRLVSLEYSENGGNMEQSSMFSYSKTNAFPDEESNSNMTQDGDWNNSVKYKYQEFDKHGNWTKRNATLVTTGWFEGENGIEEINKTKTLKQTAEYTYYE